MNDLSSDSIPPFRVSPSRSAWLGFCLVAILAACGDDGGGVLEPEPEGVTPNGPSEVPPAKLTGGPAVAPGDTRRAQGFEPGGPISDEALADYHVRLVLAIDEEEVGTMAFDLWPEVAPLTVRNFLRLADEGFYDGTSIHRIVRNFMVQGGSANADGTGDGPHGTIRDEFQTELEFGHRYGVLSMANTGLPDSGSCGFFVCCDDNAQVWGLDGRYASFGRLTRGVATLETVSDVGVLPNSRMNGEVSDPVEVVRIVRAEVVRGPAPGGETIERPRDPEQEEDPGRLRQIVLRELVIGFESTIPGMTRTREEAEALAEQVAELARAEDADFRALVLEYGDLPRAAADPDPGRIRLLNDGVRDSSHLRTAYEFDRESQARIQQASRDLTQGRISAEQFQALSQASQAERQQLIRDTYWLPHGSVARGVATTGFDLQVGEVRVVPFSLTESPRGFRVITRVE